jgi:Zn-dependent protease
MKWSWKLGEVAGIGIFVHATFFMLIVWIATSYWLAGESLVALSLGVAFILALFGCIVLHELGHALTARRYDIRTRDITLLPIGGIARLERMPDEPLQELVVALAGPAVNLAIAGILWALLWLAGSWDAAAGLNPMEGSFLQRLMVVNLLIMAFNLLPAFPMDGGRALRAILATRMEHVAATQFAANVGQAMALVFGLIGLLTNPFLIFIALFVWIGAAGEASMAQLKAALAGVPVGQATLTEFEVLAPGDPLSKVVDLTLRGSQKDFPVLTNGVVSGLLTQEKLMAGLAERGPDAPVSAVCEASAPSAEVREMLEAALARIENRSGTLLVMDRGQLVGLLTSDNVGEFLRVTAALREREQSRGGAAGRLPGRARSS